MLFVFYYLAVNKRRFIADEYMYYNIVNKHGSVVDKCCIVVESPVL